MYSLIGIDGNAFCIMGYVQKAMKQTGFSNVEIDRYLAEAKSSDYNHLLCVSVEYIDKCNELLNL